MFAIIYFYRSVCMPLQSQGVGNRSPGTFEHAPLGLEHFRCCSMSACDFEAIVESLVYKQLIFNLNVHVIPDLPTTIISNVHDASKCQGHIISVLSIQIYRNIHVIFLVHINTVYNSFTTTHMFAPTVCVTTVH